MSNTLPDSNILSNTQLQIEEDIQTIVKRYNYDNFFSETYSYSLLPAGKLFRPLLAYATALDFNAALDTKLTPALRNFACALEIHHTYTLIHDDMPCMDDDDTRRGRASTHKKFGQWQALLAGDALQSLSFHLLNSIQNNKTEILNYAHWCLGPKGLILGQALDLSHIMTQDFKSLILTHKLKTARLIQLSLVGSYSQLPDANLVTAKSLHRLGYHMGVAFQLLDDLCELEDKVLSKHESDVNPWPNSFNECFNELTRNLSYIDTFFNKNECTNLKFVFGKYISKIEKIIETNRETIQSHLESKEDTRSSSLDPIMVLLNSLTL